MPTVGYYNPFVNDPYTIFSCDDPTNERCRGGRPDTNGGACFDPYEGTLSAACTEGNIKWKQ